MSPLTHYKAEIASAESKPSRAYLFLEFIRGTFGIINAGYAAQLLPILEHYVQRKEATVCIRVRIDALFNNILASEYQGLPLHLRIKNFDCAILEKLW